MTGGEGPARVSVTADTSLPGLGLCLVAAPCPGIAAGERRGPPGYGKVKRKGREAAG